MNVSLDISKYRDDSHLFGNLPGDMGVHALNLPEHMSYLYLPVRFHSSYYAGIVFEEINEAYTTQTCSCCRIIPDSSPKGRADLGIREWTCSLCGTAHDRDVNAAKNILRVGLDSLVEESPEFIHGE